MGYWVRVHVDVVIFVLAYPTKMDLGFDSAFLTCRNRILDKI